MAVIRKWQEELVAIAWINIGLVVMSCPLFAIYIVASLQEEAHESSFFRTERGQQFVEIISKYFAGLSYWIVLSILLKIGATKPSCTILRYVSVGNLVFMFLLALQLITEPPESILVVCAYAVSFIYLLTTVWLIKNFIEEFDTDKMGDATPVFESLGNGNGNNDSAIIDNDYNLSLEELNDIADQRHQVFRLQPLSKSSSSAPSCNEENYREM